ncbi:hypothetical protein DFH07DRAFT_968794 [Mycena maculata]|uniref:DUF6593 domain-containing protein n=1 Tax=Mycena maculata TaxID=230809 RepID=A0AAD7I087_9AGAR|nr:hypothetical protein DFH07DRAFT_968794 [Mycena maculata]
MSDKTPPRAMIMEFATNSVRNTTLATENDDPYYEIVTRFWHPHITKINKLDTGSGEMNTVCEIDNKGKETKIRFLNPEKKAEKSVRKTDNLGEWMSSEEILKLAPEKPGGVFVDSDGVEYRWKTHNRNFLLIRCGDDHRLPIVVYHRHKRHLFVWRMSKHATLEIKPQIIKNLDGLVASYLLVERQRRHHTF